MPNISTEHCRRLFEVYMSSQARKYELTLITHARPPAELKPIWVSLVCSTSVCFGIVPKAILPLCVFTQQTVCELRSLNFA